MPGSVRIRAFYFRDAVSGKMSRKLFLPSSYETSFPGKVLTAGP
jgi:hypothetical protein